MKHRSTLFFVALAICAFAADPASISAQGNKGKGGGGNGGGGGSPPPGVVYFRDRDSTGTSRMFSMNADGNDKTPLPTAVGDDSEPSHALHGGHHWFLRMVDGELIAIRADAGITVQLTSDTDGITVVGASLFLRNMRWGKDDPTTGIDESDTFVSFVGTASGSIAIYRLAVDPSSGVPAATGIPLAVVAGTDLGTLGLGGHDWSPDGVRIAYELRGTVLRRIQIKDFALSLGYELTDGSDPNWSGDGATIAFATGSTALSVATIRPDATELAILARGNSRKGLTNVLPRWAPTSTHLVHSAGPTTVPEGGPNIHRITASGKDKRDLTKDLSDDWELNPVWPVAWR